MDFLIYSRSAPAAAVVDDPALDEQHWTYIDRFADGMTARGPTLGNDRETWTGSFHVVDLVDPEAARDFVACEPYNRAGRFAEHLIRRFVNVLGRTMWQFEGTTDEPRFLVLVHPTTGAPRDMKVVPLAELAPELCERVILCGQMRGLDDNKPAGVAFAVQAPTREALGALLKDERAGLAHRGEVDIQDWEFGGRR